MPLPREAARFFLFHQVQERLLGLLTDAADIAPYAVDERALFHGRPRAVER